MHIPELEINFECVIITWEFKNIPLRIGNSYRPRVATIVEHLEPLNDTYIVCVVNMTVCLIMYF